MNKRLGEFSIRNFIISYVILYTVMPIVARLTSRYLSSYFYLAVIVLLTVMLFISYRQNPNSRYGMFFLPFIIYGLLTYFYTRADFLMWGYQTLLFWIPVFLGYYFIQDKSRISRYFTKILIVAIVITMITTIIGCIQNPNAARILATVNSQDAESFTYDMKNIGGYSFIYITILLYPLMILSYKMRKISLIRALLISGIILLTIIYSEYTTALLLFMISSLLYFTKRSFSAKGIIIVSIISVLFLIVFNTAVTDFLRWLSETIGSKAISLRLEALAGGRSGLENSEDNRLVLYQMSLSLFINHPIFGTLFESYKINGGHSFILDNMAAFGMVGLALMIFMYKNVFTGFILPFKDKPGFGYVIWTFVQALILSLINTGMWLEVLCCFTPIILYWIYGTEASTEEIYTEKDLNGLDSIA